MALTVAECKRRPKRPSDADGHSLDASLTRGQRQPRPVPRPRQLPLRLALRHRTEGTSLRAWPQGAHGRTLHAYSLVPPSADPAEPWKRSSRRGLDIGDPEWRRDRGNLGERVGNPPDRMPSQTGLGQHLPSVETSKADANLLILSMLSIPQRSSRRREEQWTN